MCNKLKKVLLTMTDSDSPMTKKEMKPILDAIGDDMERQACKIENLENKVDNIQKTQNTILETQSSILTMVENINKKLNDDKIEEKAYLGEKIIKVITNWIFWVAFVGVIAFAGMGVLKMLDKADNIATITKAIK